MLLEERNSVNLDQDAVEYAAQKLYNRLAPDMNIKPPWRDATPDDQEAWRDDVRIVVLAYFQRAEDQTRAL